MPFGQRAWNGSNVSHVGGAALAHVKVFATLATGTMYKLIREPMLIAIGVIFTTSIEIFAWSVSAVRVPSQTPLATMVLMASKKADELHHQLLNLQKTLLAFQLPTRLSAGDGSFAKLQTQFRHIERCFVKEDES